MSEEPEAGKFDVAGSAGSGDVPADANPQLPTQTGAAQRDPAAARRIGAEARAGFQSVWAEWGGQGVPRDEAALEAGIEAQIAASCLGTKPLYFDPWGAEQSQALVEALQGRLPASVAIHAVGEILVIYRPEIVRPILDYDLAFYRPNGEDDLAAIARVSTAGDNGELLGYGARNWFEPHGARVLLTAPDGQRYMFFVSNPDQAEIFATERARDIQDYTGLLVTIDIQRP